MDTPSDDDASPKEPKNPSIQDVAKETERLLRTALQASRPTGILWELNRMYKIYDLSRGKTEMILAMCLDDWTEFVGELEEALARGENMHLEEITALLVHRTYNSARRKSYDDKKTTDALQSAKPCNRRTSRGATANGSRSIRPIVEIARKQ